MDQTHSLSPIHLHAHFQLTIANVASNDYVKSYKLQKHCRAEQ